MAYDPRWPTWFAETAAELRRALGPAGAVGAESPAGPVGEHAVGAEHAVRSGGAAALRIDHIGSTAVPGLAAKPIVDIQISVAAFEPLEAYRDPLLRLGYRHRADNPERTKRYFREPAGRRRTHVHVRVAGSFSEQLPLLLRDFLRADATAARELGDVKRRLAERFRDDRSGYTEAKTPYVWDLVRRADAWAQRTGWSPGPTDA